MKKLKLVLLSVFLLSFMFSFSQGSPNYDGGFKVKFNDDGSKYLRIISWAQFQVVYTNDVPEDVNNFGFNVRRARVLMFSQITDKFLILTHFGLNSLKDDWLAVIVCSNPRSSKIQNPRPEVAATKSLS